ncbi:MAG: Mur ligase family protein, partial [Candidatus Methylumidiphilus sp.]
MSQAPDAGFPLDRLLAGWLETPAAACEVRGLCLDSRKARPGDLFFAVAGSRGHGMAFAPQAVAFGAVAVLYDPAQGGAALAESANLAVPCLPLARLDQALGFIADRFFGEPSAGMTVLGITGTNGKTSCSHFLAQALDGAVIGTLGWGVPGALHATTHTTPDAIEIHALLSRLAADNVGSVA